jgi:hypothetical protein
MITKTPVGPSLDLTITSSKGLFKQKFSENESIWQVKLLSMSKLKIDVSKVGEYSLISEGKSLQDRKTLKELKLPIKATLLLDATPSPSRRMEVMALLSTALAPIAVAWVFFLSKQKLPFVRDVPSILIVMSLVGVLIYIAIIAATKVQTGNYRPLPYIPEYMLRLAEAPVFMTMIYALILQNNTVYQNQPGTLLSVSLFVGLFTRNFEEFLKTIGMSVLKAFEDYYSKIKLPSPKQGTQ